jgi:hypothetical protein
LGSASPTEDELLAFVDALLSNLSPELREPEALTQAIRDNRDMWVMLYHVTVEPDDGESRTLPSSAATRPASRSEPET